MCDRSRPIFENNPYRPPALQYVVSENKRTIEEIMGMLQCQCARDGYLLSVVSIIVFRLLGMYASAARETIAGDVDQGSTKCLSDSGQRRSLNEPSATPSLAGESCDEGDGRRRIALQQVLGELHRMQRLINILSQHLKDHRSHGQPESAVGSGVGRQAPSFDSGTPFSAAMLDQLDADLRRRLRALSDEIIETLRKE
jgi:hypothetical protein